MHRDNNQLSFIYCTAFAEMGMFLMIITMGYHYVFNIVQQV